MTHKLDNKLALIIGASNGIGLAVAQMFANNGADLALVDDVELTSISEELRKRYPNANISSHILNVVETSDSSDVENLFVEIKKHHSNDPNILVTSPRVVPSKSLLETTEREFDEILNLNLKVKKIEYSRFWYYFVRF